MFKEKKLVYNELDAAQFVTSQKRFNEIDEFLKRNESQNEGK